MSNDARLQQVEIFATTVGCFRSLSEDEPRVIDFEDGNGVVAVCRFSLGETSALVISGPMSLKDGLSYVYRRAEAKSWTANFLVRKGRMRIMCKGLSTGCCQKKRMMMKL